MTCPMHNTVVAGQPDISRHFTDRDATFVLLDMQTGQVVCHNPARARSRYLPASTFKIPNALIALDSRVVNSADFSIAWNSKKTPKQAWWPAIWANDHTLQSALRNSVVWYYQEIARRIGAQRMQSYLTRFKYGNENISGGIDQFWLTGGLRISAEEQTDFLRRFYTGNLSVSGSTTSIVKETLTLEETSQYRFSGKTGWAGFGESGSPQLGWLVGYLERGQDTYIYAINLDIKSSADAAARLSITKAVFRDFGLM